MSHDLCGLPTTDLGALGVCVSPKTLDELRRCLDFGAVRGVRTWRGQAKGCWALHSTLARRLQTLATVKPGGGAVGEEWALQAELRLIERARLAGHGYVEGRDLTDLELLGRLRHHGAATRLLDVTRNAYIAAWFAASTHQCTTGAIIGIRDGINEDALYPIDTVDRQDHRLDVILSQMAGRVSLWAPSGLSPRLAAQQAMFIFGNVVSPQSWGSLPLTGDPLYCGAVPRSLVVAVSPTLKCLLIDDLHKLHGFTQDRFFPDLDGFAQANGPSWPFPDDFFGEDLPRPPDAPRVRPARGPRILRLIRASRHRGNYFPTVPRVLRPDGA